MWVPRLFLNIYRALTSWAETWLAPAPETIVAPPPSPDGAYIARRAAALLASFAPERNQAAANANMCAEFYSREGLRAALISGAAKSGASAIEKKWAARVLAESTPRGNLFMHYDAYRSAFAYYCDANLPYALINAAAMRYVAVFACRDLFVDDAALGAERRSPLAALEQAGEELDLSRRIEALKTQIEPGLGPLPFAKLKKYAAAPAAGDPAASGKAGTAAQPATNRFVYLGRTRDMRLHQTPNSSETMTESAASCWRAKAAEIADHLKLSEKDGVGYAEYARKKRLVEKKLAETRVCETAESRLAAHLNKPPEEVANSFMEAYLTIQGCTGHETRLRCKLENTPGCQEECRLRRDAENVWQSRSD